MTPQTDLNVFPLGGHFSVEIAGNGSLGKIRSYARSCIDMSKNQKPDSGRPAAFVVSHLLDPTPTEIHVFTSLASKTPIYVLTEPAGRAWAVDGNEIRSVNLPKKR